MPVEQEALGHVTGKTLLHLQCHFGLDTLSWARKGALVTGVDFSEEAIGQAQALSAALDLPATFIASDLFALPDVLEESFDIVFTSYGVLPWLPDLYRWAEIVAHYLKPGGTFYIVEFHPVVCLFDDDGETHRLSVLPHRHPAAIRERRLIRRPRRPTSSTPPTSGRHSLGTTVTALLKAGLKLEYLREFPYCTYPFPAFLEEAEPGRYVWKDRSVTVPLMFAIKATR